MTIKLMRTRDLFWKEWRSRRWTLVTLAGLSIVAWLAGLFQPEKDDTIFLVLEGLIIVAGVIGAGFFSNEELDESRSFLHSLPLSRGKIFRTKIYAGLTQLAAFLALGILCILPFMINEALGDNKLRFHIFSGHILMAIPILAVVYFSCAIALYHMRRSLISFIIGIAAAIVFAIPLYIEFLLASKTPERPFDWSCGWLVQEVVAVVLMGGWLGYLYCRTPLAEQTATARFLLWALWVVAFLELFVFLFFTGWRDLFYLLTGV